MNKKVVQVALFHGHGFVSWAIRWQTRSFWSHAALVESAGSDTIIEAWTSGVRKKELKNWDNVQRYNITGITSKQSKDAWAFAEAQVGKPYDFSGVARFVSRRAHPPNRKWFCSELVFAALEKSGVQLLSRIPASNVSPVMLCLSPVLTAYKLNQNLDTRLP